MWYVEDQFVMTVGSNKYIDVPDLIVYKDTSVFRVKRSDNDGLLGIDFDLYSNKGLKIARIYHGRVASGDRERYDFEESPLKFSISDKEDGRLVCALDRPDDKSSEINLVVNLYMPDGFLFEATAEETNIRGLKMRRCVIKSCPRGIVIGDQLVGLAG